ncbi:MAG: hybrid sensor histidine kinase/response regulator [Heliobacteriaceae bacterium]|jgi:signal transduction histidine kinase|nr:hybrid sensor histidine kinase/response regulator [Heliobacteriaceae bacterium]
MQEILNKVENEKMVFVEDFGKLASVTNLSDKKLCIIKTNFKDINRIKKFCKNYPELEVWLASEEISRKNILAANACGVRNVVAYPIETQLIHEFFRKKDAPVHPEFHSENFLRGLKIMIVDDNKQNVDLLVETLSPMELQISAFLKPKEAAETVNLKKFDLFLLDVMMPEISGFDLANIIKSSALNENTPIMFISALSDPENKIRGFNLGSHAYIEKPFNINVVRSQIFNMLKTKSLRDALYDKKETFMAMVTHDLKSPVNAEICALEILLANQKSSLDNFQTEIITDMLSAAKYMKTLLDNVLNKYKIENGNLSINPARHSLEKLITECIDEVKYLFGNKNQSPVFSCSARNSEAYFDYIEIKRVLHNLLINANEHGYRDSRVELELSAAAEVNPAQRANAADVLILSIQNHSHMTNPDAIFDQNFREKSLGMGLGLFIAKKIIEAHKGTIRAEITPDSCMKITFTLPK